MFADRVRWRSDASGGELWQAFYWFGRATDQLAGVILNPLVVALYARALEPDLVRLSLFFSGFTLAWLAGTLLSPWLQRLTVRVTPWVVGSYIVRTSAATLLAYAVSERSSSADQRFRSVLICLIAYALATGVARKGHARQLAKSGIDLSHATRTLLSQLGVAAILGITALALFRVLSADDLGWSQTFGRVFTVAAIALGVSTLAAIKSSAAQRDIAESAPVTPGSLDGEPRRERTGALRLSALLGIGLIAVSFVEVMLFFVLFQDFRRQSTDVRTAMAFVVAGWAVGIPVWGILLRRYTSATVLQLSLSCATAAMVAALALRDLSEADWFPGDLLGRDSIVVSVYAIGLVAGLSGSGRRLAASQLDAAHRQTTIPVAAIALVGGAMPLLVARLSQETSLERALAMGIVLTLLVLILVGASPHGETVRRLSLPSRPRESALVRR